jgi:hypothetical protein
VTGLTSLANHGLARDFVHSVPIYTPLIQANRRGATVVNAQSRDLLPDQRTKTAATSVIDGRPFYGFERSGTMWYAHIADITLRKTQGSAITVMHLWTHIAT